MRPPGAKKVARAFADAHGPDVKVRPARRSRARSRLSVRVDEAERAYLERLAGKDTLSTYVRRVLLGGFVSPSKARPTKRRRKPKHDDKALAQVLAALGSSRLASNLNQIAKLANMGALPVTPDLIDELHAACADIRQMRQALIRALGMPP